MVKKTISFDIHVFRFWEKVKVESGNGSKSHSRFANFLLSIYEQHNNIENTIKVDETEYTESTFVTDSSGFSTNAAKNVFDSVPSTSSK